MSLMGLSCVRESYEFSESYESYMSSTIAYESYEFYVSRIYVSLMSLGCVWVFVYRHFHLPSRVLCVYIYIYIYKRSAHNLLCAGPGILQPCHA